MLRVRNYDVSHNLPEKKRHRAAPPTISDSTHPLGNNPATVVAKVATGEAPSREALTLRYQELHNHFRTAFDLYLKETVVGLAIVSVSLGYLFQAHLSIKYARIISSFALIAVVFGCCCNVYVLRLYRSLTTGIEKTARALRIDYDEENHRIFKIVILFVTVELLLQLAGLVYFIIWPPAPS
jgi:hypothetical protein